MRAMAEAPTPRATSYSHGSGLYHKGSPFASIPKSFILCVIILITQLQVEASVLTFQVEPRTMDCVYEVVEQGKTFEMDFEVARGGLLDIKVKIFSPRGNVILDKMTFFNHADDAKLEAEGHITFVALASGEHKICFDNTMSRWTAKVVSMLIPSETTKGHESIAKLEHLGPVVDSIIKIADSLDAVTRTQHHMAIRERNHQDTQLSTNSRVHWMAAFESCALIGMSLFQVYYVRQWLSTKGPRRRRV
eukprot:jgi/Bigna1/88381/estExt_fgenesh1_pg.C_310102